MRRKLGVLWGGPWASLLMFLSLNPPGLRAQSTTSSASMTTSGGGVQTAPAQVNSSTYQGSIVKQAPVPGVLPLSLDQAVRMGLQYNLGLVLSGTNASSAGAQRLQQLQALLPTVTASAKEAVQQTNLAGGRTQDSRLPCRHWSVRVHRHPRFSAGVAVEPVVAAELSGL